MGKSKKLLAVILMVGFVTQAHAIVALPMTGVTGFVFCLLGAATAGVNLGELAIRPQVNPVERGLLALLGIVLLDEQSGQVQFQPLTAEKSAALGIPLDEALAYNSELALVNLAFDETVRQVKLYSEVTAAVVMAAWQNTTEDAGISAGTLAAVQKISKASQLEANKR